MRGGRGQITAFFLIGLAVLFVFIIILFLRQAILSRNAVHPMTLGQPYDATRIQGYVESCIDLVANDAFQKLGQQGGLLYASQGGLTSNDDHLSLNVSVLDSNGNPTQQHVRVAIGLINDSGFPFHPPFATEFVPSHNLPSWDYNGTAENPYPWPDTTLEDLTSVSSPLSTWNDFESDGAFGQYALPPLCDPLGPNNGSTGALRCPTPLFPVPVSRNSTQASLAVFLAAGVKQCIDPAALSTQLGAAVIIGTPNVTVTFTSSETLVTLNLPLRFTAEEGALKLNTFTRQYPVRVEQLAWFTYNLLKQASKDPHFRINDSADDHTVVGYDDFVVTQQSLSNATVAGRKDLFLVTIADPLSKVNHATWFFHILVQDRAPILNPLPNGLAGLVTVRALDPDGDTLVANITNAAGSVAVQSLLPAANQTMNCTFILLPGTYNISVMDPAGLSDWQIFTLHPLPPP